MWKSLPLGRFLSAFGPIGATTNVVPGALYCLYAGEVNKKRPLVKAVSKIVASCSQ
jgi:hypothetical protein